MFLPSTGDGFIQLNTCFAEKKKSKNLHDKTHFQEIQKSGLQAIPEYLKSYLESDGYTFNQTLK